MKNLIIFIVLSFVFSIQAFAQSNSPCPTISVTSSENSPVVGETLIFTAKVEAINLDKISYSWTSSMGKIVEGQGTSIIKVSDVLESEYMTAKVEINGLPEKCSKIAATTLMVYLCILPAQAIKVDEISLRPPRIDKDKFDSLFLALNNDPTAQGYIIEVFKKTETLKNVERKFSKIFTFLKVRKMPYERVSLVIEFDDNNLTEFWVSPQGSPFPPNIGESSIQINAKTYKKDLAKIFASQQKQISQKKQK